MREGQDSRPAPFFVQLNAIAPDCRSRQRKEVSQKRPWRMIHLAPPDSVTQCRSPRLVMLLMFFGIGSENSLPFAKTVRRQPRVPYLLNRSLVCFDGASSHRELPMRHPPATAGSMLRRVARYSASIRSARRTGCTSSRSPSERTRGEFQCDRQSSLAPME